jgi:hypothetical protein
MNSIIFRMPQRGRFSPQGLISNVLHALFGTTEVVP